VTPDGDPPHQAISAVIAARATINGAGAVDIWPQIAAQLVPVIGARGVDVLFHRALQQTSIAYPWLKIAGDHRGLAALEGLRKCLASQEKTSAAKASHALLVTFIELLATLIGESLTARLLSPVWAPPLTAPEQETGT
jgi:hypothetical protein